jgi:hypothetical protein
VEALTGVNLIDVLKGATAGKANGKATVDNILDAISNK